MGCEVIVFSSTESKREEALQLGLATAQWEHLTIPQQPGPQEPGLRLRARADRAQELRPS